MKRNRELLILTTLLFIVIMISTIIVFPSQNITKNQNKLSSLQTSTDIEGLFNVKVTKIHRHAYISGFGLLNIEDNITITNEHDNPINSVLIGIHLNHSEYLIYFNAKGETGNALMTVRSFTIMEEFEIFRIFLDTPLLPQMNASITFQQTYRNLISYELIGDEHRVQVDSPVFPFLPYLAEGDIKSLFQFSNDLVNTIYREEFSGMPEYTSAEENAYLYDLADSNNLTYLEPFLRNIHENNREITIIISDTVDVRVSNLEVDRLIRDIYISPWGTIKVKDTITLSNRGLVNIPRFKFFVPLESQNVRTYDSLGEILGTSVEPDTNDPNKKSVSLSLTNNRAAITPDSNIIFTLEYNLPFDQVSSTNGLEQSIQMNIFSTTHDYLVIDQTINIVIEGGSDIRFLSSLPVEVTDIGGSRVIVFTSENVSPLETKEILVTFSINYFEILLRPVLFIIAIAMIAALFVLIVKLRKKEEPEYFIAKDQIPVHEIREFCSLYEEKNALTIEIRKAEEDAKRKKIAKKTYKNLVTKNNAKIEQIKSEITPFKKVIIETNETFENIVKKLDVLDAERVSVNDSLNLLESRYKKGRLPSKAAYQKLSDDFIKRRRKIDRSIDKFIQQLRSYLL